MTDLAERVALAEDLSRAREQFKDLIDEYRAPTVDAAGVWRFPAPEGDEKWKS